MPETLILGVGNILLSDDGVGVRVVQKLKALDLPQTVQVEDGGTCGLDLMQYLEGVSRLIVIDAADFKLPPGTIRRLEGADVPAFLAQKISPHEINLPELLFSAKLTGIYPQQVIIFGVQPGSLDTSLELTPPVAAQVDRLVDLVLQEMQR